MGGSSFCCGILFSSMLGLPFCLEFGAEGMKPH